MDTAVSRRTFLALAAGTVGPRAAMAQAPPPTGADVVIVGGDPGALAAAYRLSRTAGVRVVLVDDRPAWQPVQAPVAAVAELPAFVRGHQLCFDGWRDAGNPGWSHEDVLPAFRGLERYEGGASATRGGTGPVAVAHCWDPHALHRAFLVAAVSAGFQQDARHDFNGPRSQGVAGYYQKAQVDDRPQSFVEALLEPAVSAGVIVVRGVVGRLLTDRGRVRGVQVDDNGGRHEVRAEVAVLVAAAPVRAAQILQLSGIGPANVLRRVGIAVVADRPGVGRNLHAHVRVPVRWQARGQALAVPASTVTAGMFTVSLRASPPDLQLDFVDPAAAGSSWIGANVALVQPASRGEVRVRSSDPHAPPATSSGMLTSGADVSALVQGVRLARLIVGGAPLDGGRGDEHGDTRAVTSQAGLESLVRSRARLTADAAGTCAMGAAGDSMAVVDARLAVHGVTGLYVAGAAVMPVVVNAPTAAAALMTGDRAAEFLLNGRA